MISLCLIGLAFFTTLLFHPYVTYPLSLGLLRLFCKKPFGGDAPVRSTYGVVFCAYNESAILGQKLDNLLKLQKVHGRERLQILAYSDGSTDGTSELLRERLREEDGNIAITSKERRGKSAGMNELLSRSSNEIVVFTDANVILDDGVLDAFDATFSDPQIGVACGHLIYINESTATAKVGTIYWRLEETIKQLESDTGSAMGADGSLFAIRRELYDPVPVDIIDDFCTSMRILCRGYRVVRVEKAVCYERSTDKIKDENNRKVRIACRAMNCHRLLAPNRKRLGLLDRYKYISHKWVRWHTGFWHLGAWLFAALACLCYGWLPALIFVASTCVGLLLAWSGHAMNVPIVSKVWVVLMGVYYTALGTVQSRLGMRYQTWTPPKSARLPIN